MFWHLYGVRCKQQTLDKPIIKKKMEFDIEKLILIVQEHSVLYDTRNTNYKNIILKESIDTTPNKSRSCYKQNPMMICARMSW